MMLQTKPYQRRHRRPGQGYLNRIPAVRVAMVALCLVGGCATLRPCPERPLVFAHQPSAYYGPGQYVSRCPTDGAAIRCYHYHRHWVCEKEETLFWDRNLETAARSACGCPPQPGTVPASPATSDNPTRRVF